MKSGRPSAPRSVARSWKNRCRYAIHPRSTSGGATPAISQSKTPTASKSANSMLPMRASPHDKQSGPTSVGRLARSQAKHWSRRGERRSPTTHSWYASQWARWRSSEVAPGWSYSSEARSKASAVIWCTPASARTAESCSRARCSSVASSTQLSPNVYGSTSRGTSPSTRAMTKKGAPTIVGSGSYQRVSGMGTSVASATSDITSNCMARS